MKIPSSLIPLCPVCGKPLTTNLRIDDRFVQDDGWYAAASCYEDFLGFSPTPQWNAYTLSGTWRGNEYTRNHKISILENGYGK